MAEICVVHLVWAPLGLAPLKRFVRSYRAHPAGLDHRLHLVFKEFHDDAALERACAVAAGLDYDETHMPESKLDLDAYREMAERVRADAVFFCNSNSELLADGWLAKLAAHHAVPRVGIVGATGSWESGLSPAPLPLKLLRWRRFGPFPNVHLRTNAFLIDRELAVALRWPKVRGKNDAWALENGRRGLTAQILDRGLRALVVGRDGRAYPPEQWPESRTFRAGEQDNLLVADNRTRDYLAADAPMRRHLAELAWGPGGSARAEQQP